MLFRSQPEAPTYRFVRGQEANPDKSVAMTPGLPEFLSLGDLGIRPVSLPLHSWQPERRPWVLGSHVEAARRKLDAAEAALARSRKMLASKPAGPEREAELRVAELEVDLARAELTGIERRKEATQASWARADGEGGEDPTVLVEREQIGRAHV